MIDFKINILRNNAIFKPLLWQDTRPPDILFNAEAPIKSSLKGTFIFDEELDFNKDELQPIMITDGVETPLGVFRVVTEHDSGQADGIRLVDIEAYDRCWVLEAVATEKLLYLSKGSKYIDAITQQLAAVGLARFLADPTDAVLPYDREDWPIGTSRLEIVNTLLAEIGFDPIFFNGYGIATLRAYRPPSPGNIVRHYSSSDVTRLPMAPEWSQETDVFKAPNVFILICSNADRTKPLIATAVNESPLSPKSVLNRGLRIPEMTKVNQIADQAALQTMANRKRDESLFAAKDVVVQVLPSGGHSMGDTISIDHPVIGGIYRETSWQMRLKADELMTLNLHKEVLK